MLLPEGSRALRSLARSAIRAPTQVVTERRPLPNLEKGRREAEAVERAVGARPLQQHGLRLAHTHPPDVGSSPGGLVAAHSGRGASLTRARPRPSLTGHVADRARAEAGSADHLLRQL